MELDRSDVLKLEFKEGTYHWETNGIKQRAFVYRGSMGLRVHAEKLGPDHWQTLGIDETRKLRTALLGPSVENITVEFSDRKGKK